MCSNHPAVSNALNGLDFYGNRENSFKGPFSTALP